jgi:hypothetical protein
MWKIFLQRHILGTTTGDALNMIRKFEHYNPNSITLFNSCTQSRILYRGWRCSKTFCGLLN